jgi:hypothetical protein
MAAELVPNSLKLRLGLPDPAHQLVLTRGRQPGRVDLGDDLLRGAARRQWDTYLISYDTRQLQSRRSEGVGKRCPDCASHGRHRVRAGPDGDDYGTRPLLAGDHLAPPTLANSRPARSLALAQACAFAGRFQQFTQR